MDLVVRSRTGGMMQLWRLRCDTTMLAGAENAYFQDEKDGYAKPYGTVMVNNFLIEHKIGNIRSELEALYNDIHQNSGQNFEDWLADLEGSLSGDVTNLQRIERFVMYSTFRYIVRDRGQVRQRTLRKRISKTCSLK
jgi:hypothetical protein